MAELVTRRLRLRQWRDQDAEPFAKMNADPRVMVHYPNPYLRTESDALMMRFRAAINANSCAPWAVERLDTETFIGYIGLSYFADGLPFAPCVEVGWRLAAQHWGQGFATEGAIASLAHGFDELGLDEIVSMTATTNAASERVMQKIGLVKKEGNFMHPRVADGHRLQEHVLYSMTRDQWLAGLFKIDHKS